VEVGPMEAESLQQLVPYKIVPRTRQILPSKSSTRSKRSDIDLDFSVKSLKKIDKILEDYSSYDGVTPMTIVVTRFELGYYVGEVIVRNNSGSKWKTLGDDEVESSLNSGLIVRMPKGTEVHPIGKAEKRLVNGEGDSIAHFYKEIVRLDSEAD
jgi:hypothetical protein